MAFTILKPSNIFCLLILLLILHSPTSCKADNILTSCRADNILYSGDTLYSGQSLQYGQNYRLKMQDDCNLVLSGIQGPVWLSNTRRRDPDCKCTLEKYGDLVIYDGHDEPIWQSSKTTDKEKRYVLALENKGILRIYGPVVWNAHKTIRNVSDAVPVVAVMNNALGRKAKLTSPQLLESVVGAVVN